MPIVADALESGTEFGRDGITFPREPEKDEQRDQANENVHTVEAGQSKERGRKHVGADIDPALEKFPVFVRLAAQENRAERNGKGKPAKHRSATLFVQGYFRAPESEAAREQTYAENQRSRNIQFFRSGTRMRMNVEI